MKSFYKRWPFFLLNFSPIKNYFKARLYHYFVKFCKSQIFLLVSSKGNYKKTPKNNGWNIDKKLTFCSPLYAYFFCNTKKIKLFLKINKKQSFSFLRPNALRVYVTRDILRMSLTFYLPTKSRFCRWMSITFTWHSFLYIVDNLGVCF